jgi:hypothetical protein
VPHPFAFFANGWETTNPNLPLSESVLRQILAIHGKDNSLVDAAPDPLDAKAQKWGIRILPARDAATRGFCLFLWFADFLDFSGCFPGSSSPLRFI